MSERVQKQRPEPQKRTEDTAAQPKAGKADLSSTDALLDEIDAVLDETLGEQSAEEFVAEFVNRGGQ